MVGALKPRGFDLEVTRLRAPGRIRKLIALLPVAFIWSHLVASGWTVAPGKRGAATAQKARPSGEERISVRT